MLVCFMCVLTLLVLLILVAIGEQIEQQYGHCELHYLEDGEVCLNVYKVIVSQNERNRRMIGGCCCCCCCCAPFLSPTAFHFFEETNTRLMNKPR